MFVWADMQTGLILILSNTALAYLLASQPPRPLQISCDMNQKCLLTLCLHAPEYRFSAEAIIDFSEAKTAHASRVCQQLWEVPLI